MNKFVLLLLLLLPSQAFAQDAKVEFPFIRFMKNADYKYPTRFQDGSKEEGGRVADDGTLVGHLWMPVASNGSKLPFVILMHGCSGYSAKWAGDWANWLNSKNIAALAVDSDGPRHKTWCSDDYWAIRRTADAYSALEYLKATYPQFDPLRVYVIGMSGGARAALRIADDPARVIYPHHFTAVFSLYANCSQRGGGVLWKFFVPVYEYIGTEDDSSSYTKCIALEGTPNFQLKVYKGAYHAFDVDVPMNFFHIQGLTFREGVDYHARNDVMNEVVKIIQGK
jgi:dienelactone hydrolase